MQFITFIIAVVYNQPRSTSPNILYFNDTTNHHS